MQMVLGWKKLSESINCFPVNQKKTDTNTKPNDHQLSLISILPSFFRVLYLIEGCLEGVWNKIKTNRTNILSILLRSEKVCTFFSYFFEMWSHFWYRMRIREKQGCWLFLCCAFHHFQHEPKVKWNVCYLFLQHLLMMMKILMMTNDFTYGEDAQTCHAYLDISNDTDRRKQFAFK